MNFYSKNKNFKIWLNVLLFSLFFCKTLYASDVEQNKVLVIDSIQDYYLDLNDYLYIYEDSTNQITIDDIHSSDIQNKFTPYSSEYLTYKRTYWGKITIKNKVAKALFKYLVMSTMDEETVFVYENGEYWVKNKQE